jgi:hypothetical protein
VAEPIVIKEERPPAGSIWRDELIDTLNAGLGAFLQHVEVEASLEEGRFKGFRVLQLIPPGYWDGVDLEPGDVAINVNGMPIERETDAYAAFEALRSAREIRVAVLRTGSPHETVITVVERGGVPVAAAVAASGSGGMANSGAGAAGAASAAGGSSGAPAIPSSVPSMAGTAAGGRAVTP